MIIAALIVAAGRGTRARTPGPKQFEKIGGTSILARTLTTLANTPRIDLLQVVINPGDMAQYEAALAETAGLPHLPPAVGSDTRALSVRSGLEALARHSPDYVLIHDAARPFTPLATIDAVIDALLEGADGACPALPVVDALWTGSSTLDATQAREGLLRAQTPQGFPFPAIRKAHATGPENAADDVAVARAAGLAIRATCGSEDNYKITTPADFKRAERMLPPMDPCTGCGYDVHAFEPGTHVTLCGIDIPHTQSLKGHSDADVAMHTITDALFGAIGEGDIGQWFPPSEPEWKGAASKVFLAKAVERVAARGGRITHIDCTIICEQPKIGAHAPAMRARIAEICRIALDRVSIKATTSERLGFTGREEGIAAMGTATVVLP